MPVRKVQGGYQWGQSGRVYPTKAQAERQGRAVYASGYRGGGIIPVGFRRWASSGPRSFNTGGIVPLGRKDSTKVVEGGVPEDSGITGLLRKGWRAAMETPLYPNSPTTLGDAAPGMLQGARFIPTVAGDVAELTNFGINLRDPEYRAQLWEPPTSYKKGDPYPFPLRSSLLSLLNQPQMEGLGALLPIGAGMTAWHGSPHKFSRFKASQIGTGEGAQSYGHGLYFSENPNVAKDYSYRLSRDMPGLRETDRAHIAAANDFKDAGYPIDKAREGMKAAYPDATPNSIENALNEKYKHFGNLYEVDIPDEEIAKMLDWDAPLSEQPKAVRDALESLNRNGEMDWLFEERMMNYEPEDFTGRDIHQAMLEAAKEDMIPNLKIELERSLSGSKEVVSEFLKEWGTPGIKYYDQGSRGAGKGTRNFVVFDENLLKIIGSE